MIDISEAVTAHNDQSLYEWFINQEHIPFDMSSDAHGTYYVLYQQFLEDLNKLYSETGDRYYWFTSRGKLVSDRGSNLINGNHIRIDKVKLRDIKINSLLSDN